MLMIFSSHEYSLKQQKLGYLKIDEIMAESQVRIYIDILMGQ
jgi:hypothetical protein